MAERRSGRSSAITSVRGAGGEEAIREHLDAGRPGAFAHADEHAAVADHEHVAALERRVVRVPFAPVRELASGEARVMAVDRAQCTASRTRARFAMWLTQTPP